MAPQRPLSPLRLLGAGLTVALAIVAVDGPATAAGAAAPTPPPAPAPAPTVDWTAANPPTSPPALANASSAYDADNGTVVLFGGTTPAGTLSDDTWIWNGTTWSEAPVSQQHPQARESAAMSFDPALHQLILFGGSAVDGTLLNDTWAWNGATWYQLAPATSPSPRQGAGLAYDRYGHLVLFGGTGYTAGPGTGPTSPSTTDLTLAPETALGDTWLWGANGWVRSPATGPPARTGAALAYDGTDFTTVLFGGTTVVTPGWPNKVLSDTWLWNGVGWVKAAPAASPPGRALAVADNFPALGGAILTTGYGGSGWLADSWKWARGQWAQTRVAGPLSPRAGAAGASDGAVGSLVVYGGAGPAGVVGDTIIGRAAAGNPAVATTTTTPRSDTTNSGPTSTPARAKPKTTGTVPPHRPPPTTVPPAPSVRAGGEPQPSGTLSLQTGAHAIRRGSAVRLAGTGFAAGSRVQIMFHSTPALLGWATADATGRFEATVSVPDNAAPGEHHILATGTGPDGQPAVLAATVFVIVSHHGGIPAATGWSLVTLALLIPLGAYLVMEGLGIRRRRRSQAE